MEDVEVLNTESEGTGMRSWFAFNSIP